MHWLDIDQFTRRHDFHSELKQLCPESTCSPLLLQHKIPTNFWPLWPYSPPINYSACPFCLPLNLGLPWNKKETENGLVTFSYLQIIFNQLLKKYDNKAKKSGTIVFLFHSRSGCLGEYEEIVQASPGASHFVAGHIFVSVKKLIWHLIPMMATVVIETTVYLEYQEHMYISLHQIWEASEKSQLPNRFLGAHQAEGGWQIYKKGSKTERFCDWGFASLTHYKAVWDLWQATYIYQVISAPYTV